MSAPLMGCELELQTLQIQKFVHMSQIAEELTLLVEHH